MEPVRLARGIDPAIDPGSVVQVADTPTVVLDADDADTAQKVILQNNTDTAITISLQDTFELNEGVVLLPGPDGIGGGTWEEERWAGVMYARHHGAPGNKPLTRLIF
jgi:hypothetical protein